MGSTHPHRCHSDGQLVAAASSIPTDPADHAWGPAVRCGCNALVCGSCRTPVTWGPVDGAAALRYSCGCSTKEVDVRRWIADWLADEFTASVPNWRCGGHPARPTPFDLDGIAIAESPDWRAVIDAAARDERVPSSVPGWVPDHGLGWLERIAATVSATEQARFDRALIDTLLTAEAETLRPLLVFVRRSGRPVPSEAIVRMVAGGQADAWLADDGSALHVVGIVERATREAGVQGQSAIEAMRRLVLASYSGVAALFWPLAEQDPDWLAANAARILRQYPGRASRIFGALKSRAEGALPGAIDGALKARVGTRYDLERAIWDAFEEPERATWLKRLEDYPEDS